MKRVCQLSNAQVEKICKSAGVPIAAGAAFLLPRRVSPGAQVRHATAGRDSRLAVYVALAPEYHDSGLLGHLMDGNLDAPAQVPAGGYAGYSQFSSDDRNAISQQLSCRAGSAP